jgi:hypothetical protein
MQLRRLALSLSLISGYILRTAIVSDKRCWTIAVIGVINTVWRGRGSSTAHSASDVHGTISPQSLAAQTIEDQHTGVPVVYLIEQRQPLPILPAWASQWFSAVAAQVAAGPVGVGVLHVEEVVMGVVEEEVVVVGVVVGVVVEEDVVVESVVGTIVVVEDVVEELLEEVVVVEVIVVAVRVLVLIVGIIIGVVVVVVIVVVRVVVWWWWAWSSM